MQTGCRDLSTEEVAALLSEASPLSARDRLLLALGCSTGYRIKELLALTVGDVLQGEEVARSLHVARLDMKRQEAARTVPLGSAIRQRLADYIVQNHLGGDLEMPLFPSRKGSKPLTAGAVWLYIKRACEALGIDASQVGTHSMRKTFASRLWEHPLIDKDIVKMADALGHKDINNTRRYIRYLDSDVRDAITSIAV